MKKETGQLIGCALVGFVAAYILAAAFNNNAPNLSNWIVYPLIVLAALGIAELISMIFNSQKKKIVN
ncbi:hypothetical protein [Rossellomorea aquimaris]|uniref:Uncharacterized protein n=1 Tax=Rossellomorea aquimaris TaxID=189382 RepID=A0A5D4TMQ7_9BACI|nr:hypothetical protein [Rossellomorea aquimaris]TYS75752.1 hypothetical protein FZC80_16240 [Rossellomorea aquimaris]